MFFFQKSINHEIPQRCFLDFEKVRIFSSHHFLALYSPSKILVLDIENLEKFQIFEFPEIISLIVLNGNLCFINSSGIVFNLEKNEKILESSPLLHPILASFQIENRIFLISQKFLASFGPDSPLDYETYETEKTISNGEVRKFGENRLMIFDRKSQICSIWEMNKPKSPSHQLCFGSSEYTVDVACDETNLYSLTAAGVVSVWKLRPNGRKYRDQLFTTYLNHCSKLLYTHPQKFVILTTTEVHFVVFGTETTDSGPQ
ncbi:hypothetical protein B9Z55_005086 [Caenorhabditis nigoni]|uniref:Uncharacterized protein n=1 Tax=Caenorhabditis nigoni TaxID=1611254 RepID=A0A2G5UZC0_9PELO|nr:hypothetical protein B9Z55_005086 [Caenorhabditis nigoni]